MSYKRAQRMALSALKALDKKEPGWLPSRRGRKEPEMRENSCCSSSDSLCGCEAPKSYLLVIHIPGKFKNQKDFDKFANVFINNLKKIINRSDIGFTAVPWGADDYNFEIVHLGIK